MSVDIVNNKESIKKFVKCIRTYIQYNNIRKLYEIHSLILSYQINVYYDKESYLLMYKFKFDDGFEIKLTNDELNAILIALFYEIDLMQTNNEVEIKKEPKESKENIWHFNPDLAEYLPNGKIKRLQTMINHFKEEGFKIFEKTHDTLDVIPALRDKCSYTKEEYEILFIYKFDNGTEIELTEDDIHTVAKVIDDEF